MFTKEHIIAEIKRTAEKNGGKPLGKDRFYAETGINSSDWQAKHWVRWSDALIEAGFEPNTFQGPIHEGKLLDSLVEFTRELGHIPVANEIKMKGRKDPEFPSHTTFSRFGNKQSQIRRLREYCISQGYDDVVALCDAYIAQCLKNNSITENSIEEDDSKVGYVYLLKSGRYYKIGHTNSIGRREYEIALQLPEKGETIHSIKTDDPVGIEDYWHRRLLA